MKFTLKLFCFLLVTTFAFNACTSKKQERIAKVSEVMKIHDDVMPKMDEIVSLQGQVKAMMTAINSDSANIDKRLLEKAEKTLDDLNKADVAMWDWMNAFKMPVDSDPRSHVEIMAYLEEEHKAIEKVSEMMLTSIDNGNALIKENE
ncbi:MAG: hypothetical protein AAF502_02375 [Bacteroidota bacterium]